MPILLEDLDRRVRELTAQLAPIIITNNGGEGGGDGGGTPTGALLGSVDNIVNNVTSLTQAGGGAILALRRDDSDPPGAGTRLGTLGFGSPTFGGFSNSVAASVASSVVADWGTTSRPTEIGLYATPIGATFASEGLSVAGTDHGTEVQIPQGQLRFPNIPVPVDHGRAVNDGTIRQAFGIQLWQDIDDQENPPWRSLGTCSWTYGETTIDIPGGGLTQADVGRYLKAGAVAQITIDDVTFFNIGAAQAGPNCYIKSVSSDGTQLTLVSPSNGVPDPFHMVGELIVVDINISSPLHIMMNRRLQTTMTQAFLYDYRGGFTLSQNQGPRGAIQIDGRTVIADSNTASIIGLPIAVQTGEQFTSETTIEGLALGALGFNFSSQLIGPADGTITLKDDTFGTAFVDNFQFGGNIVGWSALWISYANQFGVLGNALIGEHTLLDAISPRQNFTSILGAFRGVHVHNGPQAHRVSGAAQCTFGSTTITTTADFFDVSTSPSPDIGRRVTGITGLINDCFAPNTVITAVANARSATVSHGAIASSASATLTVWVTTLGNMVGIDIERLNVGGVNTGIRNASTTVFPSKIQAVSATQAILPDTTVIYITSTAAVTLPTENITTYNAQDGQAIEVVNIGAYPITFTNGQGVYLGSAATLTLQSFESAKFAYRGASLGIVGQLWSLQSSSAGGVAGNTLRLDGVFNEITAPFGFYGAQAFGTNAINLTLQRARGTKAAPDYVHALDTIQGIAFQGYNDIDAGFSDAALMFAFASEDYHTAGAYGGILAFAISPPGSGAPQTVLQLANDYITASRRLTANVGVEVNQAFAIGGHYVATAWGTSSTAAPAILDLRGGRGGGPGAGLNIVFDVVSRIFFAGGTRKSSQPNIGVARIDCVASETWTDNGSPNFDPQATGSTIQFYTTANGTTSNHGDFAFGLDTTGINIAGGRIQSSGAVTLDFWANGASAMTVADDFVTTKKQLVAKLGVSAESGVFGLTIAGSEYGGASNLPAILDLRGGRGTGTAPLLQLNGDQIARVMFAGSTHKVAQPKVGTASINAVATQNWTDTGSPNFTPAATGTKLEFWTNPNGTTTNHGQLAMTLDQDATLKVLGQVTAPQFAIESTLFGIGSTGDALFHDVVASGNATISGTLGVTGALTTNSNLVVGGTSSLFGNVSAVGSLKSSGTAGVGYATGAGGAVTQGSANNKSTTVLLNKPTGQITMAAGVISAGAFATFTLTNSAIAATDHVVVDHISVNLGAYAVFATPAAGSASIAVKNITAASANDQLVLRFSVIKSVNA